MLGCILIASLRYEIILELYDENGPVFEKGREKIEY